MKQDWEVKKLGDICEIELGKTPFRKDNSFWDTEKQTDNVWLSIADLLNAKGNIISDSKEYITDKAVAISKVVKEGTLLVSFKLTLGRLAFAGKDLFTNEAIAALSLNNQTQIDKYFLYHYLNFFDWDAAAEGNIKVKGKTLNKAKLKNIEIYFPKSLPEQKRIVAILDKAFAAIGKAKANAEQNLKNAKELFESYLQGVFENKGDGWEVKKLGDVCIVKRGSSPRPIKKFITNSEEGVNWIKIGDTKDVDKFIYTTRQKITKEGAKKSRFVKKGDFILSNSMSFGKPYIMKIDGYIHDGWFVLRLHSFIDTDYFFHLLSSPYVDDQFHKLASGSVVKNISGDLVKKVVLPIPPLPEQQTIVKKLDALSAETKKLKAIYQKKIDNLQELKKSILQKAFVGEL